MASGALFSTSMNAESNSGQKVYVQPEQITLQENRIFVNLSQGQFLAPNLGVDKKGYFVYTNELLTAKVQHEYCPGCGFGGVGSDVKDQNSPSHKAHRDWRNEGRSCESRHGRHGKRR